MKNTVVENLKHSFLFFVLFVGLSFLPTSRVMASNYKVHTEQFLIAISKEGDPTLKSRRILRWDRHSPNVRIISDNTELSISAEKYIRSWAEILAQKLEGSRVPNYHINNHASEYNSARVFLILGSNDHIKLEMSRASQWLPLEEAVLSLEMQTKGNLPLCSNTIGYTKDGQIEFAMVTIQTGPFLERCVAEELTQTLGLRGEFTKGDVMSVLDAGATIDDITPMDLSMLKLLYSVHFDTGERPRRAKILKILSE